MTFHQQTNDPGATAAPAAVPWARQVAPTQPRATARSRSLVRSLPSWDPLPPGEILVRRRGKT